MKKGVWVQLVALLLLFVPCSSAAISSAPQKTRTPTAIVHGDPPSQCTRYSSTDTRAKVYLHAYASTYSTKALKKHQGV